MAQEIPEAPARFSVPSGRDGSGHPLGHLGEHLVGDPADGVLRVRGAVDLGGEMSADLPVVRRLAYSDSMMVLTSPDRRCHPGTIGGSKLPLRSRGTSVSTGPQLSISTVLVAVRDGFRCGDLVGGGTSTTAPIAPGDGHSGQDASGITHHHLLDLVIGYASPDECRQNVSVNVLVVPVR